MFFVTRPRPVLLVLHDKYLSLSSTK